MTNKKTFCVMKRFYIAMMCLLAVGMAACNDDDDKISAPSAVRTAFDKMYPEAKLDGWLGWRGYVIADFELNNEDAQAWYDKSGKWYMTDTEIDYRALPAEVRTAYQNSAYATDWNVGDMERLERAEMQTIYILEVWQGRIEIDLYYTPEGLLAGQQQYGYGDPTWWIPRTVPEAIATYLSTNFEGYQMIQLFVEGGQSEALISHESKAKSVIFNASNAWTSTSWSVSESELPAEVVSTLEGSEYADYIIRSVEFVSDSSGEWYRFALTNGGRNVVVKISSSGDLIP